MQADKPKHRFLFLSSNLAWGGSEELWSQTAAALAQAGHEVGVRVLFRDTPKGHLQRLSESGCVVQEGWLAETMRSYHNELIAAVFAWLKRAADSYRFRLFFRRFGTPDLAVISQGINHDGQYLAQALRYRRIPYVLVAQKATELYWPSDAALPNIRDAYESALRCYFASEHNLRLTEEQLGLSLSHGAIVRNPFKVSWDKIPGWSKTDEGIRLACIGRMETNEKGQDILLRVLAMDKWRARPVTASFFGSGPHSESLERMAQWLNLGSVKFCGHAESMEAIWENHHALVLPSRCEGLPIVIVEAMLQGRLVITTRVAGNPEFLEHGITGFIAESSTEAALDAALEEAWSRRHEWQAMGAAAALAIRKIVPKDPPAVFARQLLELVEKT